MEYAATVTVNPLTAIRMLNDFVDLKSGTAQSQDFMLLSTCVSLTVLVFVGDSIVQNGATSIVGQCIIQLARDRGIHSINIIRDRCFPDYQTLPPILICS